ncbi:MAG: S8 family serine peptidase [Pyrobaculum sp.]
MRYVIMALILALFLYAQTEVAGVNPSLLDTNTPVVAKITVTDLDAFASQWKTTPKVDKVKIDDKEVSVISLTVDKIKLQGRKVGELAELYYKGPASFVKTLIGSPYVRNVYVKTLPEVPPRDFFAEIRALAEGGKSPQPTLPVMREIIGATKVEQLFNVNGTGVVIAVVDTGVDYGHPDLQDALAWLIKTTDGREIVAASISTSGSTLQYRTLRGETASIPLNQVASVEPLVLDADESHVSLLKPFTASGGFLPTANKQFDVIDGVFIYSVTAGCNYNVAGLVSKSGVYKFGMTALYIPWYGGYVTVGVVMYDPDQAEVYTAARVDVNDNCNFGDDLELRYFGNRLVVNNLNTPTRSLGVAGGYFYDWGLWLDGHARFYPGWDLDGRYLSIFYDFHSHGTACSSVAAGRGKAVYSVGTLRGIAPGAKVLGVKGLWWGMVEPGMMWAAGFDVKDGQWYWTRQKRAHVISNSWGISTFIYDYAVFGYDFESAFINGLAAPGYLDRGYPGIVIIHAGGNGGYGFGTITSPGAALGAITVGAATSGHFWLALGIPFRGFSWGDIISWSLRGPTPAGYVKPDVVNIGAFGIAAYPVGWGAYWYGSAEDWDIFGGTSQATPLTAGVAALVLSSIATARDPATVDPFLVRQILASTAADIGYTPFTAGHGFVNATAAVIAARSYFGLPAPKAPVALFRTNSVVDLGSSWDFQWRVNIPYYFGYLLNNRLTSQWSLNLLAGFRQPTFGMTSLYMTLTPGGQATGVLTVTSTDRRLRIEASAVRLEPIYRKSAVVNIPVGTFGGYFTMGALGFDEGALRQAELVVFRVSYRFSYFDPEFDYLENTRPVLWVFSWKDVNNDGAIQTPELIWLNYGYQRGTAVEVPVARPGARLGGDRLVLRIDVRRVQSPYPATVPVVVEVVAYRRAPADDVSVIPSAVTLPPRQSYSFVVTVRAPANMAPTAFERMVLLNINGTVYVVPLSYTVRASVPVNTVYVLTAGRSDSWYNASEVRGANDWRWRYESGDWRVYYISTPTLPRGLYVDFRWSCVNTSLISYTVTRDGFFAGRFPNQGFSYHHYLGGGIFRWAGTGGAARIVTMPASSFAIPVTTTASYYTRSNGFTVITRTALYGGCSTSEAISGSVRPFITSGDMPVMVTPTPFVKFAFSTPPVSYLYAIKFAEVMGGGFVVPQYTYGTDLQFDMIYVKLPVFIDYVAALYSPQYATVVWDGANYYHFPFYFLEGVSIT